MSATTLDTATVRRWKRYPKYKDSRHVYLGGIPAHWEALRLKWVATKIGSGKTPKGGAEVYSDSGVLFLRSQNVHFDGLRLEDAAYIDDVTDCEMSSTRVAAGDVLLNITGASLGRCCVVPRETPRANVNQHVCIIRPSASRVSAEYLSACVASHPVQEQVFSSENGVSREGLNYTQTANLVFATPPSLEEQLAIATFVDRETRRIDALIGHKERLSALLEEKRQAVISHAVTRGLDPTASLKYSGVPWLGTVPTHWTVGRLKHRVTSVSQGWSPQCESRTVEPGEWGVLKVGCMNSGIYDESECKALPPDLNPLPELEIRIGDVLMSRSNTVELVGMTGIVDQTQGRILLCDKLYRIDIRRDRLNPEFAVFALRSASSRSQIEPEATGASPSMRNISADVVRNLVLAFPPVTEQREIATQIKALWASIDRLQGRIRDGIARLQEYRTALISAAVTGQIDVRGEVTP